VPVEEWPRRDDYKEGESGAGEANLKGQRYVLQEEADKEGDGLFPNSNM
jgi:hypothetical protein